MNSDGVDGQLYGDWQVSKADFMPGAEGMRGVWYEETIEGERRNMTTEFYRDGRQVQTEFPGVPDHAAGMPVDDDDEPFMVQDPAPQLTDESERAQDDHDRRPRKPKSDKSGPARVRANDRWAARKAKANRERMKTATDEPFIEDKIVAERQPQIDALRVAYERSVEAVDAIASNLIDYPGSPYTAATIENLGAAANAIGPLGDEIRKWEQHQIDILQDKQ